MIKVTITRKLTWIIVCMVEKSTIDIIYIFAVKKLKRGKNFFLLLTF